MASEWKLVPVKPTKEMKAACRVAGKVQVWADMIAAAPQPDTVAVSQDTKDWLTIQEEQCLDLRCRNAPTGGDDCDVVWEVVEHHMAEPRERVIGSGFTPREAIDRALLDQEK